MTAMPDETLRALGFEQRPCPYTNTPTWTHPRSAGQFYYEILTPWRVSEVLIEMGHREFLRRALDELSSINMNRRGADDCEG